MKELAKAVIIIFICLSFSQYTVADNIKGINYDPAHSQKFIVAQNVNDIETMKTIVNGDFQQIRNSGFIAIKTFYSQYCTIDGNSCVSIASLARQNSLLVALGVFEFGGEHGGIRTWTKTQVDAAIKAANNYPDTVIAIVVGNEDIADKDNENNYIIDDIINDIKTIRQNLNNKDLPLGTAQISSDLDPESIFYKRELSTNIEQLVNTSSFIGITVYPFWVPPPLQSNNANIVSGVVAHFKKAYPSKNIVVAEEGWPTAGDFWGSNIVNQNAQNQYYTTWQYRQDDFNSYYFAMYDKISVLNNTTNSDSADNYFGLCDVNGKSKPGSIFNCKLP